MAPLIDAAEVDFTWNLWADLRHLFDFPFMVHAFEAGTVVAVTAGALGWFMVLRRQSFAGHTLALVGFPGAAGAVWVGISATWGYFASSVTAALLIAVLPRRARGGTRGAGTGDESAVTGVLQALALASGYLFVTRYGGNLNGVSSALFGTFLGITRTDVLVLAVVGVVVLGVLTAIGRPLLFATIDPEVAATRHVPVRLLGVAFLVLLGLAAAAVSQITGTLLVFALLVMPAATAQRVTARPGAGLAVSIGLAVGATWSALAVAYYSPYPVGFFLTTFAFVPYVAVALRERAC